MTTLAEFTRFLAARPYLPSLVPLLLHGYRRLRSLHLLSSCCLVLIACGCRPTAAVFEVASSSMAPTLLGPSRLAGCPHCQNSFPIAADTYRSSLPTRCGQCGGTCQVGDPLIPGERVAITPAHAQQTWQRLDLIAFKDSTSRTTQVKRVWGLPNEKITLQGGEILIANQPNAAPRMFQKTLKQLMQTCVPISNFPGDKVSGWRIVRDNHPSHASSCPVEVLNPATRAVSPLVLSPQESLQWTFRRPAPVRTAEVPTEQWLQPGPIDDDYQVNQGISCSLHEVGDYLLSMELQAALNGEVVIYCRQGARVVPVTFRTPHSAAKATLGHDEQASRVLSSNPLVFPADRHIQLAWCDQRLLIETELASRAIAWSDLPAMDSEILIEEKPAGSPIAPTPMLRIEAKNELRLKQIFIARDLYFDDWLGENVSTEGYFVLGDNLPVSVDSRSELGRIAPQQIIGSVRR